MKDARTIAAPHPSPRSRTLPNALPALLTSTAIRSESNVVTALRRLAEDAITPKFKLTSNAWRRLQRHLAVLMRVRAGIRPRGVSCNLRGHRMVPIQGLQRLSGPSGRYTYLISSHSLFPCKYAVPCVFLLGYGIHVKVRISNASVPSITRNIFLYSYYFLSHFFYCIFQSNEDHTFDS